MYLEKGTQDVLMSLNKSPKFLNVGLHAISPLENPEELKKVRRGIARMKSELRTRELNQK